MLETVGSDKIQYLKDELKRFIEAYTGAKLIGADDGQLNMHILHIKNSKNSKIKEKMINYKLLRVQERLLGGKSVIAIKDYYICEFLIEELKGYVFSLLK